MSGISGNVFFARTYLFVICHTPPIEISILLLGLACLNKIYICVYVCMYALKRRCTVWMKRQMMGLLDEGSWFTTAGG